MIIAAHSGTGKTYLATNNPKRFVDLESRPFKYFLENANDGGEADKANTEYISRPGWRLDYVKAVKEVLSSDKIVLIPSDSRVLALLREENIPYLLVYPERNAKEEYRNRFIGRGNSEEFLNIFIEGWDIFLDILERDPSDQRIIMKSGQYLSDVIDVENI